MGRGPALEAEQDLFLFGSGDGQPGVESEPLEVVEYVLGTAPTPRRMPMTERAVRRRQSEIEGLDL